MVPKLDAILILDGDGDRLAGKYYSDFLGLPSTSSASSREEARLQFEKQLHAKVTGMSARGDAAEVVHVQGRTVVFCGGTGSSSSGGGTTTTTNATGAPPSTPSSNNSTGDVRVVHVGPPGESELVLALLCEGMYNALSQLMGGSADRSMVLDNLELVFLLIDEHCDGGIILETDPGKLAAAVLLRDGDDVAVHANEDGNGNARGGGAPASGGAAAAMSAGDMTIAQALRQARQQFLAGLSSTTTRDGM